jgi:methylthioribose-1-phosphate isomerase
MKTLEFNEGVLSLIDQTLLPIRLEYVECRDHRRLCEAIKMLRVRGAPAIGIAAGYGVVLAAQELRDRGVAGDRFQRELLTAVDELHSTRPTAVNLAWALDRMRRIASQEAAGNPARIVDLLLQEANRIAAEDDRANQAMGQHGAALLPEGVNVLTHCNAGGLATGEFGTAVGVIIAAHRQGKHIHVWVDETRPLLQGARLTAWELEQEGVPYTLITDSMAGHFMARGRIDMAMVGADRVAANGDAANKIGTYGVATLARAHDLRPRP